MREGLNSRELEIDSQKRQFEVVINKKDEEMRELKQSKKELESQVSFLKLENSESERNFQKQLSELALQNN